MPDQKIFRAAAFERRLSGQDFVQRDAERIDIRPRRDRLLQNLLRSHIGPRSLDRLLLGEDAGHQAGHARGQREIDQPDFAPLGGEDVIRLDIAMHPAVLMQMLQRERDQFDHAMCPLLQCTDIQIDLRFQVGSGEQLHREIAAIFRQDEIVIFQQVRVCQRRPDLVLVLEAVDLRLFLERFFEQQLHRHSSPGVARRLNDFPDLAVLTRRKTVQQFVLIDEQLIRWLHAETSSRCGSHRPS